MQVVVEEEQRPEGMRLHDDGAVLGIGGRLVLTIGPHQCQRQARIGDEQIVFPERHACDHRDEDEGDHAGDGKKCPLVAAIGITFEDEGDFRHPDAHDADGRSDDHAAGKGVVDVEEEALHRTRVGPVVGQEIIGLGIARRVGEVNVVMVLQVCVAVAAIGQPEGRRDEDEKFVQPALAGGMAVQNLVLQGGMEGGKIRADGQQPPRQHGMVPDQRGEDAIDEGNQSDGRPFDAGRAGFNVSHAIF